MGLILQSQLERALIKTKDYIDKKIKEPSKDMININHGELVSLREKNLLVPGMQYRIIDYVTTTGQENTRSSRKSFDIIVTADSTNTLNEEARVCLHEGDTYFSNAGAKLEAWKIWYCLDNDINRFAWAGALIPDINTYKLTIDGVTEDVVLQKGPLVSGTQWYYFNHTKGKAYTTVSVPSNNTTFYKSTGTYYPKINVDLTYDSILTGKGVIYRMIDEWNNDCPYDFKNIQFKHPNDTTTYPDYYYTFSTVIDGAVTDHSMLQGYCYDNTMKEYISSEKQTLNNNVFLNTSIVSKCYFNYFGTGCYSNSFGTGCCSNSFGHSCNSNSFGTDCYSNSFGTGCDSNSFGNDFQSNSFGNYCANNLFVNNCQYNSFGNWCYYNSFGNNCQRNSFGNVCSYNSFRSSADISSSLRDYIRCNHFDDGCSYNVIWNSSTTSSGVSLKNININRGVSGTSSNYNFINIDTLNVDYEIQVAKNSKGEIKIYCEADLIA